MEQGVAGDAGFSSGQEGMVWVGFSRLSFINSLSPMRALNRMSFPWVTILVRRRRSGSGELGWFAAVEGQQKYLGFAVDAADEGYLAAIGAPGGLGGAVL